MYIVGICEFLDDLVEVDVVLFVVVRCGCARYFDEAAREWTALNVCALW